MDEELRDIFQNIKDEEDIFKKIKLIDYLRNTKKLPLTKISQGTGIKSSYLCHILRLKKLPALIIDGYYSKLVAVTHLFIIARLKNEEDMIKVYEAVLADNLTVANTEEIIREILYKVKTEGNFLSDEEKDRLIQTINEKNLNVKIIQTRTRGKIIIEKKGSLAESTKTLSSLIDALTHSK